ncbi:unnamed protein product [Candidula unifasciata]|uniref:Purple acid phosphatase n=1 Tax=Candidula unifasciata TaxID=100452 RepID=A0A8S3Z7P6_9EUPU|nr:unnamed protein product [Candidula unifasciata]
MKAAIGVFAVLCLGLVVAVDHNKKPRHVHIAYGEDISKMMITWSTLQDTSSYVLYVLNSTNVPKAEKGVSTKFTDGGAEQRVQYIHRVQLKNLKDNATYYYLVGSAEGWSVQFSFKTMPAGEDWNPSLAVFGDLGSDNAQSLPRLQSDIEANMYDALIHVGDLAYNLDANNGRVGDTFMQQIQVLAANVPYMTCVGNHEYAYNFSNYKARFSMPNDNGKMYYSFNMGPAHFISISTEYLYFTNYGYEQIFNQYEWLKQDLMEANKAENRQKRPWIIVFGHRPMYCSNNDGDDCTKYSSAVRKGIPSHNVSGLEDLFYEQGVDVAIWAHEHSYERLWPIYNEQVRNGSYDQPYKNPGGIVHVITGSAGCSEGVEYFVKDPPAWSAFRNSEYGYMRMKFLNRTHLYMEQVSDDQDGEIIDKFTVIKEQYEQHKNPMKYYGGL